MKKLFSLLVATIFTVAMSSVQVFAVGIVDVHDSSAYTFDIAVSDENGDFMDDADVSLYSYLDSKVVRQVSTEESGTCSMYYKPSFEFDNFSEKNTLTGSNEDIVYGDYIVYVSKDGYKSELYYLTKGYTQSNNNSFDEINNRKISIVLQPEEETTVLSTQDEYTNEKKEYQKKVYEFCVQNGKISNDNPVYILQQADKDELFKQGVVNPDENHSLKGVVANYRNVLVPIGTFHAGPNAQVDVSFSGSNTVSVQAAVDGAISGSTSRTLGSTANYSPFVTSTYQKQTYYTVADFVEEESLHVGGYIRTTVRLDRIIGGTSTANRTSCSLCGKSYRNLSSGSDGSIVTLRSGSSEEQYENTTVDAGLTAAVSRLHLGVTHSITSGTQVKYTAGSKNVWLYDKNFSGKTWHVTSE